MENLISFTTCLLCVYCFPKTYGLEFTKAENIQRYICVLSASAVACFVFYFFNNNETALILTCAVAIVGCLKHSNLIRKAYYSRIEEAAKILNQIDSSTGEKEKISIRKKSKLLLIQLKGN